MAKKVIRNHTLNGKTIQQILVPNHTEVLSIGVVNGTPTIYLLERYDGIMEDTITLRTYTSFVPTHKAIAHQYIGSYNRGTRTYHVFRDGQIVNEEE